MTPDGLEEIIALAPSLLQASPLAFVDRLQRAGVNIAPVPGGRELLLHFMTTANEVMLRHVADRLPDRLLALVVLQAVLRIDSGEISGLVTTTLMTEPELGGWLGVADLLISDARAARYLADRSPHAFDETARTAGVPGVLLGAKLAVIRSRHGRPSDAPNVEELARRLGGWLRAGTRGTRCDQPAPIGGGQQ